MMDWLKASWTNIVWVIAGIIVALDPGKVEEWARRHEGWADLIIVLFGILLSWAAKQRGKQ